MSTNEKVRVEKIEIRNILGIETLEIEPGSLTLITGKNEAGKTSVLEAIRSVIEGGHDATLLRNGEDEGEVVFLFDDGVQARKRVTEARSNLTVKHPEHGAVGKAQTYIDNLTDALSINPVAFLTARPKDRVAHLLEAMPLDLDPQEIVDAVDGVVDVPDSALEGHALEAIDRVRTRVYDERTGVNRLVREHQGTVKQLEGTVDDVEGEDPADEIAKLEAERDEIHTETEREVESIRSDYEMQIDDLRQKIRTLERNRDREIEEEKEAARDRLSEIREQVATLRERQKAQAQARQAREALETQRSKLDKACAESDAMTKALDRIDALKLDMVSRLPLDDVEVRDGDIYVDDVAFDRLNRARQVKVAMRLAKLRAGKLGLVCVDGLECLDAETFEAFRAEAAEDDDVQFVVTRVSEGDLTVETE